MSVAEPDEDLWRPMVIDPPTISRMLEAIWENAPFTLVRSDVRPLREITDMRTAPGHQNPYWDLLLAAPVVSRLYRTSIYLPLIGADPATTLEMFAVGAHREPLSFHYTYAVPSPMNLRLAAWAARGRGIVEIGAGTGYWAWMLAQHGVDVVAYDEEPPGSQMRNTWVTGGPYHPVLQGGPEAAAEHSDRALMLFWPPMEDKMASACLDAYRGDTLILCCEHALSGDERFWDTLARDWHPVTVSPWHLRYYGMKDVLAVLRRR